MSNEAKTKNFTLPWNIFLLVEKNILWIDHAEYTNLPEKLELCFLINDNKHEKKKRNSLKFRLKEQAFNQEILNEYGRNLYRYSDPEVKIMVI